jgi:dihydrolipoamide dehydrogenase
MNYDIIIIGSGPGGYVAAIRASQLGFKTAVIEKAELGGICLNWGCIPTKSLLKSAQVFDYVKHSSDYGIETGEVKADFQKIIERSRGIAGQMSKGVEYLFKKNNITLINGIGKIIEKGKVQVTDSENVATIYETKHIILATGSRSKELPFMKQDGKKIIGYRQALSLDKLPETMIVAGSGAIGTELAFFYNSMGTQVTIVEFLPNSVPTEDEEVSKTLARSLKKVKIKIMTESAVESVDTSGEKCKVTIKTKKGEEILEADIILSAIGIMPNIENLGIEENKIELEKGKIKVDDYYKTNIDEIYAIGDIVRGPALAHVASAEGIICIENIAGLNPKPLDYENIPGAIYTTPEVASVGFSEAKAIEAGYKIKIGKFPFTASGKATAAGNRDGFIKLVFDEETDKILGAHMIGMNVTEMISEIVVARNLGAKGHQIIKSVHPHPTMSEAIMEAAANAHNEAIHI